MNDYELLPAVDVAAPPGALAWAPSFGFVFAADELLEARGEGELLLDVEDDVVADVEGPAPLATLIRADRQLDELRQLHAKLAERVGHAGDQLAGLDTAESMDRADVLVRLRRLAERVAQLEEQRMG
jgi:hypothetical protein